MSDEYEENFDDFEIPDSESNGAYMKKEELKVDDVVEDNEVEAHEEEKNQEEENYDFEDVNVDPFSKRSDIVQELKNDDAFEQEGKLEDDQEMKDSLEKDGPVSQSENHQDTYESLNKDLTKQAKSAQRTSENVQNKELANRYKVDYDEEENKPPNSDGRKISANQKSRQEKEANKLRAEDNNLKDLSNDLGHAMGGTNNFKTTSKSKKVVNENNIEDEIEQLEEAERRLIQEAKIRNQKENNGLYKIGSQEYENDEALGSLQNIPNELREISKITHDYSHDQVNFNNKKETYDDQDPNFLTEYSKHLSSMPSQIISNEGGASLANKMAKLVKAEAYFKELCKEIRRFETVDIRAKYLEDAGEESKLLELLTNHNKNLISKLSKMNQILNIVLDTVKIEKKDSKNRTIDKYAETKSTSKKKSTSTATNKTQQTNSTVGNRKMEEIYAKEYNKFESRFLMISEPGYLENLENIVANLNSEISIFEQENKRIMVKQKQSDFIIEKQMKQPNPTLTDIDALNNECNSIRALNDKFLESIQKNKEKIKQQEDRIGELVDWQQKLFLIGKETYGLDEIDFGSLVNRDKKSLEMKLMYEKKLEVLSKMLGSNVKKFEGEISKNEKKIISLERSKIETLALIKEKQPIANERAQLVKKLHTIIESNSSKTELVKLLETVDLPYHTNPIPTRDFSKPKPSSSQTGKRKLNKIPAPIDTKKDIGLSTNYRKESNEHRDSKCSEAKKTETAVKNIFVINEENENNQSSMKLAAAEAKSSPNILAGKAKAPELITNNEPAIVTITVQKETPQDKLTDNQNSRQSEKEMTITPQSLDERSDSKKLNSIAGPNSKVYVESIANNIEVRSHGKNVSLNNENNEEKTSQQASNLESNSNRNTVTVTNNAAIEFERELNHSKLSEKIITSAPPTGEMSKAVSQREKNEDLATKNQLVNPQEQVTDGQSIKSKGSRPNLKINFGNNEGSKVVSEQQSQINEEIEKTSNNPAADVVSTEHKILVEKESSVKEESKSNKVSEAIDENISLYNNSAVGDQKPIEKEEDKRSEENTKTTQPIDSINPTILKQHSNKEQGVSVLEEQPKKRVIESGRRRRGGDESEAQNKEEIIIPSISTKAGKTRVSESKQAVVQEAKQDLPLFLQGGNTASNDVLVETKISQNSPIPTKPSKKTTPVKKNSTTPKKDLPFFPEPEAKEYVYNDPQEKMNIFTNVFDDETSKNQPKVTIDSERDRARIKELDSLFGGNDPKKKTPEDGKRKRNTELNTRIVSAKKTETKPEKVSKGFDDLDEILI